MDGWVDAIRCGCYDLSVPTCFSLIILISDLVPHCYLKYKARMLHFFNTCLLHTVSSLFLCNMQYLVFSMRYPHVLGLLSNI